MNIIIIIIHKFIGLYNDMMESVNSMEKAM